MNLEILKKLIKLANNNPNENEANSAARKACKLIEEDNFKILNGNSIPPTQTQRSWAAGYSDIDDLIRRAKEYADREDRDDFHYKVCSKCKQSVKCDGPAPYSPDPFFKCKNCIIRQQKELYVYKCTGCGLKINFTRPLNDAEQLRVICPNCESNRFHPPYRGDSFWEDDPNTLYTRTCTKCGVVLKYKGRQMQDVNFICSKCEWKEKIG